MIQSTLYAPADRSNDKDTHLPNSLHEIALSPGLPNGELMVIDADILSFDGKDVILRDVCLRIPPASFVTISGMRRIINYLNLLSSRKAGSSKPENGVKLNCAN